MTPTSTSPGAPTPARSADLELARLHLRLGSLALARAELETLAGRDALDDDGLVDLAEVRWRTGDVTGAGEAAQAILGDADDGPLLALVVAAEAAMVRGRPTESRRLAERAVAAAGATLDAVFAGMPRAAVWPPDPADLPPPDPTLFDVATIGSAGLVTDADLSPDAATARDPASLALWDDLDVGADEASAALDLPAPDAELERGRDALVAGRHDAAAVHLGLVLRLSPVLAPAVLDLVGADRSAELAFVRGDAYRLVGRELEARRAFARALRPDVTTTLEPPHEGDPA
ncbi:MAG: hypothetical protein WEC14_05560 [Chloroflexota bacterium]